MKVDETGSDETYTDGLSKDSFILDFTGQYLSLF